MIWYMWAGATLATGYSGYVMIRRHRRHRRDAVWINGQEEHLDRDIRKDTRDIIKDDASLLALDDEQRQLTGKTMTFFSQKRSLAMENLDYAKQVARLKGTREGSLSKREKPLVLAAFANARRLGHLITLQADELRDIVRDEKKEHFYLRRIIKEEKWSRRDIKKVKRYRRWEQISESRQEQGGRLRRAVRMLRKKGRLEKKELSLEKRELPQERTMYEDDRTMKKLLEGYHEVLRAQLKEITYQIGLLRDHVKYSTKKGLMNGYLKASENLQRKIGKEASLIMQLQEKEEEMKEYLEELRKEERRELKDERLDAKRVELPDNLSGKKGELEPVA
ncbi:MAG: hypothetical protein GXP63_06920 [DPANN group archaeon]|nr:hypothetical protein [DPANN group archaeon]